MAGEVTTACVRRVRECPSCRDRPTHCTPVLACRLVVYSEPVSGVTQDLLALLLEPLLTVSPRRLCLPCFTSMQRLVLLCAAYGRHIRHDTDSDSEPSLPLVQTAIPVDKENLWGWDRWRLSELCDEIDQRLRFSHGQEGRDIGSGQGDPARDDVDDLQEREKSAISIILLAARTFSSGKSSTARVAMASVPASAEPGTKLMSRPPTHVRPASS